MERRRTMAKRKSHEIMTATECLMEKGIEPTPDLVKELDEVASAIANQQGCRQEEHYAIIDENWLRITMYLSKE